MNVKNKLYLNMYTMLSGKPQTVSHFKIILVEFTDNRIKQVHTDSDMEFYVKCPQAAYRPSKMSTQVTTMHSVK